MNSHGPVGHDAVRILLDLCDELDAMNHIDVRPSQIDDLAGLSDLVYGYLNDPQLADDPRINRDGLQALFDRSYAILERLLP